MGKYDGLTENLKKVFQKIETFSDEKQDEIANFILTYIEDYLSSLENGSTMSKSADYNIVKVGDFFEIWAARCGGRITLAGRRIEPKNIKAEVEYLTAHGKDLNDSIKTVADDFNLTNAEVNACCQYVYEGENF